MGETTAGLVGGTAIIGIQQVPGLPPYPEVMLESLVDDAERARRVVPARGRRHHRRGRAGRPEPGRAAAQAVRPVPPRLLRHPRQPRPRAHRRRRTRRAASASGRATTASTTSSSRATSRRTSVATCRVCASSGSTPTTSPGNGSDPGALSHRAARLVPRRAREGPRPADDRVRPPPAHRREVTVPDHAEQHARRGPGGDDPRRLRADPGLFLHHAGHTHRNKRTISPVAPGGHACRRSPRARSTPAASRCCGSTPAASR